MAYRPERGWGFSHHATPPAGSSENPSELENLRRRITELEHSVKTGNK
jgi:hypothetical protein